MLSFSSKTEKFILIDHTDRKDEQYSVACLQKLPLRRAGISFLMTGRPVPVGGDFVTALQICRALNTELRCQRRRRRKEN
jgi:hypothetical protein